TRRRAPARAGLAADVAARLGPRAHRLVRGALARASPRRRSAGRAVRRRLRRVQARALETLGAADPDPARGARLPRARPQRHAAGARGRVARRLRSAPRRCVRLRPGRPARAPAPGDDAADDPALGRRVPGAAPRRHAGDGGRARARRPVHARHGRRALGLRQRAARPRRRAAGLLARAPPGHERALRGVRRGRRLPHASLLERGGLELAAGGAGRGPALRAGRARRLAQAALRALRARAAGRAGSARLVLRGGSRRCLGRQAAPDRGRVGEGGERDRTHPVGLGVDILCIHRLPRLRVVSVPRVLGGLLRRRAPRAARRLVGDRPAGRAGHVPELGLAAAAANLQRRATGVRRMSTVLFPAEDRRLALREEALHGLTSTPKELPPKWFYDRRGSELFEAITRLPEYYLTRAERSILERRADEIAGLTEATTLIELGSGTSDKTRLLLDALSPRRFVPFDVSEETLRS